MLPRAIWHRSVLSCLRAIPAQPGALSLCQLCELLPAGSHPVPEFCASTPLSALVFKRYNNMKSHPYEEGSGMKSSCFQGRILYGTVSRDSHCLMVSLWRIILDISGTVGKYSLTRCVILFFFFPPCRALSVFLPPRGPCQVDVMMMNCTVSSAM